MLKKVTSSFLVVTVTSMLCSCGASSDEYKKFSLAGQSYSTALEKLVIKSAEINVDKVSESLLLEDFVGGVTTTRYGKESSENKLKLESLRKIVTQTRLLRAYFNKLEILANSDSPKTVSTSIDNIASNISKLNVDLKPLSFLPSTISLSISSNIRQSLRNELQLRGKTIFEALEIQGELISTLREQINTDMKIIINSREVRNVVPPIANSTQISNPEEWIKLRRSILTYDNTVNELSEASQALAEFKYLFKAILEDKLTSARIESFLKETDEFIKIIEKNKVEQPKMAKEAI